MSPLLLPGMLVISLFMMVGGYLNLFGRSRPKLNSYKNANRTGSYFRSHCLSTIKSGNGNCNAKKLAFQFIYCPVSLWRRARPLVYKKTSQLARFLKGFWAVWFQTLAVPYSMYRVWNYSNWLWMETQSDGFWSAGPKQVPITMALFKPEPVGTFLTSTKSPSRLKSRRNFTSPY